MADKRKRDHGEREGKSRLKDQKRRKGFNVGPDNLPDGLRKRKIQKIKENLVEKAQIKRKYAQLKKHDRISGQEESIPIPASFATANLGSSNSAEAAAATHPASKDDTTELDGRADVTNEPHPDRQALLNDDHDNDTPHGTRQLNTHRGSDSQQDSKRPRRAKPAPFRHEHAQGQTLKQEISARRQARKEAILEAARKTAEREKFRKSMAKARTGGVNGQRKLGRESKVLLARVQKMMN